MISTAFILTLATNSSPNMNGDIYGISNPNQFSKKSFSTVYSEINPEYEYFEVYSPPITSRYAEVFWTMMPSVKLPNEIINRFSQKTMAIVG